MLAIFRSIHVRTICLYFTGAIFSLSTFSLQAEQIKTTKEITLGEVTFSLQNMLKKSKNTLTVKTDLNFGLQFLI